jgi:hypothetical protein
VLAFVIFVSLCVAVGMFASMRRNRSGAAWGLLTALLSVFVGLFVMPFASAVVPLLAFMFLAILPALNPRAASPANHTDDTDAADAAARWQLRR